MCLNTNHIYNSFSQHFYQQIFSFSCSQMIVRLDIRSFNFTANSYFTSFVFCPPVLHVFKADVDIQTVVACLPWARQLIEEAADVQTA